MKGGVKTGLSRFQASLLLHENMCHVSRINITTKRNKNESRNKAKRKEISLVSIDSYIQDTELRHCFILVSKLDSLSIKQQLKFWTTIW